MRVLEKEHCSVIDLCDRVVDERLCEGAALAKLHTALGIFINNRKPRTLLALTQATVNVFRRKGGRRTYPKR